ncbi:hypothetical protein LOC71_08255 [Rhodopirellula sp. JC740]|uniref:Leucine Rich repeats (2 copies) n=1 Tax=Rhodopirellula halodulae TaxID=2894198 RepID=A0ABS8NFQ8_9BACT|nr:hypothetical protein [Rhodopirellula sp. JC740]MCC9642264.1 hypothetical protein [Rhodopirellula sp. JC740]
MKWMIVRRGPVIATVTRLKEMHILITAMRLTAILLFCWLAGDVPAQEAGLRGVIHSSDDDTSVVSLHYGGSDGLRRSAPESLEHIRQVEIDYGTTLTSDDVAFLSSLEGVSDIWIGGNLQSEYVTIESDMLPLSKLKHLENLFLCKRDMQDKDLAFVAELPEIQYLEFLADTNPWDEKGLAVTDDCANYLCRATTLRHLLIYWGDNLTDRFISEISQSLEHLEHLDVDSSRLTDNALQMLAQRCTKLKWLDVRSNLFTDKGVGHLANAKRLEMLWLQSESLSHQCIESVAGLVRLRHLELTVPTVTDGAVRTLANLPELEILALRQPPLTDEQFAMFENHPTLESAFLNGRDLTEANVIRVIKTIPNLRHLDVGAKNGALQNAICELMKGRQNASMSAKAGG